VEGLCVESVQDLCVERPVCLARHRGCRQTSPLVWRGFCSPDAVRCHIAGA
jgi:hypothetical protein